MPRKIKRLDIDLGALLPGIPFYDFERDAQGVRIPYTFEKGTMYHDTAAHEYYLCIQTIETTLIYPIEGPFFEFIPVPTVEGMIRRDTQTANQIRSEFAVLRNASGGVYSAGQRSDGGVGSVTLGTIQSTAATGNAAVQLGGYKTAATLDGATSIGGSWSSATAKDAWQMASNFSTAAADSSGVLSCYQVQIPASFPRVVAIGINGLDLGLVAPFTDRVLLPNVGLMKPGTGMYLTSPDGATTKFVSLNNSGQLLVGGQPVGSGSGGGSVPAADSIDVAQLTPDARKYLIASSRIRVGESLANDSVTYPGIWFGAGRDNPTVTNYAFLFDPGTTGTILNTPQNGYFQFRVDNDYMNAVVLDRNKNFSVGAAYNYLGQEKLNVRGRTYMTNSEEPATPSDGGIVYVHNGALWYKGPAGTKTMLAPA